MGNQYGAQKHILPHRVPRGGAFSTLNVGSGTTVRVAFKFRLKICIRSVRAFAHGCVGAGTGFQGWVSRVCDVLLSSPIRRGSFSSPKTGPRNWPALVRKGLIKVDSEDIPSTPTVTPTHTLTSDPSPGPKSFPGGSPSPHPAAHPPGRPDPHLSDRATAGLPRGLRVSGRPPHVSAAARSR